MNTNTAEYVEHLRRAYRDLAYADQQMGLAHEATKAAGVQPLADRIDALRELADDLMDDLIIRARDLGREL